MSPTTINHRFTKVKKAFDDDGFRIVNLNTNTKLKTLGYVTTQGYLNYKNCLGIMAEHKTATTGKNPKNKKRAYYIEGNHYQMGYLMGLMAEKEIRNMSVDFVDKVIPDIINLDILPEDSPLINYIKSALIDLFGQTCIDKMKDDVPEVYQSEIRGIYEGCNKVNQKTKVNIPDLWSLNFGIDLLFSHLFTGAIFKKKKIPTSMLSVPMMCNAFSLHGKDIVGKGKHFFGRDFMFATADVFQKVACMIVYNPESDPDESSFAFVSQTAPGFVGSIAAMNTEGVAMGVDVFMSGMCDPDRPGFNSLGLVRDVIQHSRDIRRVVDRIIRTRRGVSWFYPVVDGKSHKACFIEAGRTMDGDAIPYFDGIPKRYRRLLPDETYIRSKRKKYNTPPPQNGLMIRWSDYRFPDDYIDDFNQNLWKRYSEDTWRRLLHNIFDVLKGLWLIVKSHSIRSILHFIIKELPKLIQRIPYHTHYFKKRGYINPLYKVDKNCPGPYFFAPQREDASNIIIVNNHAITPEMRLTAMADWVAGVSANRINDFQWRYDELSDQLHRAINKAINNKKPITNEEARNLIDYLRPNEDNPNTVCRQYYNSGFEKDLKDVPIEGSISLFELNSRTVWSRFGYYSDEWVCITLPKYI